MILLTLSFLFWRERFWTLFVFFPYQELYSCVKVVEHVSAHSYVLTKKAWNQCFLSILFFAIFLNLTHNEVESFLCVSSCLLVKPDMPNMPIAHFDFNLEEINFSDILV